jgi:hypothetical protein
MILLVVGVACCTVYAPSAAPTSSKPAAGLVAVGRIGRVQESMCAGCLAGAQSSFVLCSIAGAPPQRLQGMGLDGCELCPHRSCCKLHNEQ